MPACTKQPLRSTRINVTHGTRVAVLACRNAVAPASRPLALSIRVSSSMMCSSSSSSNKQTVQASVRQQSSSSALASSGQQSLQCCKDHHVAARCSNRSITCQHMSMAVLSPCVFAQAGMMCLQGKCHMLSVRSCAYAPAVQCAPSRHLNSAAPAVLAVLRAAAVSSSSKDDWSSTSSNSSTRYVSKVPAVALVPG